MPIEPLFCKTVFWKFDPLTFFFKFQNVSFRYNEQTPYIYKNLEFGLDLDSRLALVGPNGAGKSTLLKLGRILYFHQKIWKIIFINSILVYGELVPTEGMVRRNNHLKIGRYHQHLHELLEMDLSPLDYMMKKFPEIKERDEMRKIIGRYGITGKQQVILKYDEYHKLFKS